MSTLRIKNWDKFQHYKSGRNASKRPEWIRLYTRLLDDIEFHDLSGDDAKALVMLWALASEQEGDLPDEKTIAFRLRVTEQKLRQTLGRLSHWVESAYASPRTEEKREEEIRGEEIREDNLSSSDDHPLETLFSEYNEMAEREGFPVARVLTADRRRKLAARVEEHGVDGFREGIAALETSEFCRGGNDRGWRADFDFLLQPKSLNRLRDGGYQGGTGPPAKERYHNSVIRDFIREVDEDASGSSLCGASSGGNLIELHANAAEPEGDVGAVDDDADWQAERRFAKNGSS